MKSTLRRLLIYLLLLLMPLQSLAALAACPHLKSAAAASTAAAAEPAMDHCLHEQAASAERSHDGAPQHGDQTQPSCCAAMSGCVMCMAATGAHSALFAGAPQQLNFFYSPQYTSFIPDGLQRPPSILA